MILVDGRVTAESLSKCIKHASDSRRFMEREWFLNDLFGEGIHTAYYSNSSSRWNTVQENMRTIDMYGVIKNGLVNSIIKNSPRPEVRLSYGTKENKDIKHQKRVSNIFLASLYENEGFEQTIQDAVSDSLGKNEGWVFVDWDDANKDGVGEIRLVKDNAWNILRDPNGTINPKNGTFDGEWIIRQTLVPLEKIKNNPNYEEGRKGVRPYGERDPNRLKSELMGVLNPETGNDNELGVVQEVFYRKWVVETRDSKKYQALKFFKKIYSDDVLLEDETDLPVDDFPAFCYQVERKNGEFNIRPHMSKIIPLNKVLDTIVTKMEKQMKTMNVGRILKHKTTNVEPIMDRDGQIIEWEGSRPPELMNQGGISGDLFNFFNVINQLMQDTGYFHLESAGGGGNVSGIALAQKQAGDIFNVTSAVKNLSLFVGSIFKYTLALASKYYVVSRTIYDDEGTEYKIIGDVQKAPSKAVKLQAVDSVKVDIVPGGVYSDVQFKQDIMELYQLQLADKETVLEAYKVGKTGIILDRLEDDLIRKQGLVPVIEKAIKSAEEDFAKIIKGESVKVPSITDKDAQNAYLLVFVKNIQGRKFNLEITTKLNKFIEKMVKAWGLPIGAEVQGQGQRTQQQGQPMQGGEATMQEPSTNQDKLFNQEQVAEEEIGEVQAQNDQLSQGQI